MTASTRAMASSAVSSPVATSPSVALRWASRSSPSAFAAFSSRTRAAGASSRQRRLRATPALAPRSIGAVPVRSCRLGDDFARDRGCVLHRLRAELSGANVFRPAFRCPESPPRPLFRPTGSRDRARAMCSVTRRCSSSVSGGPLTSDMNSSALSSASAASVTDAALFSRSDGARRWMRPSAPHSRIRISIRPRAQPSAVPLLRPRSGSRALRDRGNASAARSDRAEAARRIA